MLKLGDEVKDIITGAGGVVTAITHHLTGCTQAYVLPRELKEGAPRDGGWFDVQRLEITRAGAVMLDNARTPGFGPTNPMRRETPAKRAP